MIFLANIINDIFRLLILIVIIQAVLSFFMDPYHPIRMTLDRIVNPLLNPIRRVIPPIANLDLSPIILIVILQIVDSILVRLLISLA
jgi:YggT family protein